MACLTQCALCLFFMSYSVHTTHICVYTMHPCNTATVTLAPTHTVYCYVIVTWRSCTYSLPIQIQSRDLNHMSSYCVVTVILLIYSSYIHSSYIYSYTSWSSVERNVVIILVSLYTIVCEVGVFSCFVIWQLDFWIEWVGKISYGGQWLLSGEREFVPSTRSWKQPTPRDLPRIWR